MGFCHLKTSSPTTKHRERLVAAIRGRSAPGNQGRTVTCRVPQHSNPGTRCKAMDTVEQLPGEWRTEADLFEECGSEGLAKLLRRCAAQLEQRYEAELMEELPVPVAAHVSGYSAEHLRVLIRAGELRAVRRGGRIFIRRADLPRKPTRAISTVDALAAETASQRDPPAEPSEVERIAARLTGTRIPE